MNHARSRPLVLAAAVALLAGCAYAPAEPVLPQGARYVAMGSSFAAGPGITQSADTPPDRCRRSVDNYAHQLARRRSLNLVDVSCSGATTAHLLGPWDTLAPQLDAVTADTRLVTVTIGGNDVNYVGSLIGAADGGTVQWPDAAAWTRLAESFDRIANEVRRRAPDARLVFVDYVTLLPQGAPCAQTPVTARQADVARAIGARLERETAAAATRAGAGLIRASALSRRHDPCAAQPFAYGSPPPVEGAAPYHPNLAGMTAIADALDASLPR